MISDITAEMRNLMENWPDSPMKEWLMQSARSADQFDDAMSGIMQKIGRDKAEVEAFCKEISECEAGERQRLVEQEEALSAQHRKFQEDFRILSERVDKDARAEESVPEDLLKGYRPDNQYGLDAAHKEQQNIAEFTLSKFQQEDNHGHKHC